MPKRKSERARVAAWGPEIVDLLGAFMQRTAQSARKRWTPASRKSSLCDKWIVTNNKWIPTQVELSEPGQVGPRGVSGDQVAAADFPEARHAAVGAVLKETVQELLVRLHDWKPMLHERLE